MVKNVYSFVFEQLGKKNWKLWGITLLYSLLCVLSVVLFFGVPALSIVLIWMFTVALSYVFIVCYENGEIKCEMLFSTFKDWNSAKRAIGSVAWADLWIFIWSLIPFAGIVLGIIKKYEYSLVPFIAVKEPEIGITATKEESSKRTSGFKGSMFLVELIYTGVVIVSALILGALARIPFIGGFFGVILFLLMAAFYGTVVLISMLIKTGFYVEIEKRRPGSAYYVEPSADVAQRSGSFCPNCGTAASPNDKFCSSCGAKLN